MALNGLPLLPQVFYLLKNADCPLGAVLSSCNQFQREMATAGSAALCPHLSVLMASGINCIGLRISTDTDMVRLETHVKWMPAFMCLEG